MWKFLRLWIGGICLYTLGGMDTVTRLDVVGFIILGSVGWFLILWGWKEAR